MKPQIGDDNSIDLAKENDIQRQSQIQFVFE
jgi:hypothetical protein